jgi:hypothetical protein
MKLDIDPGWLLRMASKEGIISVGGLVSRKDAPMTLWHFMPTPGVSLCGDDGPNQGKTIFRSEVTCEACLASMLPERYPTSMKYRKKTVVVEAIQFTAFDANGRVPQAILDFVGCDISACPERGGIVFSKPSGSFRADVGDWLTRDDKGHVYAIREQHFREQFEPVKE